MKHYYKDLDATGKIITVTDYREAVCFENGYRYAADQVCKLLNHIHMLGSPHDYEYNTGTDIWKVGYEYDTVNDEEISFYVVYKDD